MKHHAPKEAAADRQPAAASTANSAAMPEAATAPPDSARMRQQAAQLKRLRGGGEAASEEAGPERGGLPAQLRAGLEAMSGQDLGDVRVHYGSSKPAQLEAHAYAQGRDIHLAPGQEQHLPHEAWHVVQQAQGRVKPTTTMGGGVPVNDHGSLEREADVMGARAQNAAPVQRKGRIDTSKIEDGEKRQKIEAEIKRLKDKKRADKRAKVTGWSESGKKTEQLAIEQDDTYNTDIEGIRAGYEQAIAGLAGEHALPLVHGEAYYGAQVEGSKVFRRPDNGKEYVKDRRGTFVPRYVRRELNDHDDTASGMTATPKTYKELLTQKGLPIPGPADKVAEKGAEQVSWPHREFIQQAMGGGGNQFAFSHTSTKRPILSNMHKSFGEQDPSKPIHKGAVITDLSQLDTDDVGAQWQLDPVKGHKVRLAKDKLSALTKDAPEDRDKATHKVQMSGYRNMEVVTRSVPSTAVVAHGLAGWNAAEGSAKDYFTSGGKSTRGDQFATWRDAKSKANHDEDLEKIRLAKEAEAARIKESETGTTDK